MPPRKFFDFGGFFLGGGVFFAAGFGVAEILRRGTLGKTWRWWGTGYGNAEIAKKRRWRGGENRTRKRQVVENIVGRSKWRLAARKTREKGTKKAACRSKNREGQGGCCPKSRREGERKLVITRKVVLRAKKTDTEKQKNASRVGKRF